jgi:hypothetical protein
MGMMLDDQEQKLLYKLVIEELRSHGFNEEGSQVTGKVRPSDLLYVRLLLSTLKRIKASVIREAKRKKRYEKSMEEIEHKKELK